jgi:hypothetical protein
MQTVLYLTVPYRTKPHHTGVEWSESIAAKGL